MRIFLLRPEVASIMLQQLLWEDAGVRSVGSAERSGQCNCLPVWRTLGAQREQVASPQLSVSSHRRELTDDLQGSQNGITSVDFAVTRY